MRLIVMLLVLLAGCSELPALPSVTPYRMDIQQGNMVTQDMVEKLKPGMSRAQVRFSLGTPLVADPFHPDRWDYVYLYNKAGKVTEQRRLIVIFKDDRFVRVEGDKMPPPPVAKTGASDAKPAASPATGAKADPGAKPPGTPPPAAKEAGGAEATAQEPKDEEKGFFGRILEKLGF
jgi:outer membrane protein assembly factor BamE